MDLCCAAGRARQLAGLSDRDFGRVDFHVGLLAERAEDLGEPYTRHLSSKVRELRSHLLAQQTASPTGSRPAGESSSLLSSATLSSATRNAETAEVACAVHAQKVCEADHGPAHDTFGREVP